MSHTMHYKGYDTEVVYEAEDDLLVGHILNISDIVGFDGDSIAQVRAAFEESVDDYLAHCKNISKQPNKPFTGKVMFRIGPLTHVNAAPVTIFSFRRTETMAQAAIRVVQGSGTGLLSNIFSR